MDTMLNNGGFVTDARGLPLTIKGVQALAQQAYIRLAVPKGSFALDPQLGSNLHRLPRSTQAQLSQLAADSVREALAPLPTVMVETVQCRYDSTADAVIAQITLKIDQQLYEMEVTA